MSVDDQLTSQLEELLEEFRGLRAKSQHDDLSGLPDGEVMRFVTRARAAIHRVAGNPSPYFDQCQEIIREGGLLGYQAKLLFGVLDSLRADTSAGYLRSQRELIHGELFGDFLEMAQHLLDEGYKDAAAVIAGSSLEAHLRRLCVKVGVDVDVPKGGSTIPKKADRLNSELANVGAYSKLDQKNVTAWLDLRNHAAHGHYDLYETTQVTLLISGVRDFMTRSIA